MTLISSKLAWIPVYVGLFVILLRLFGWKGAILTLILVVLGIFLTDQVSSSILKPLIGRLRPCHEPEIIMTGIHLVSGKCGGQYGFVSSHAANFGFLGTFLLVVLPSRWRLIGWAMMVAACLVAYSRVYLGVHYPADVLGGLFLGALVAGMMVFLRSKILTRFSDSLA